MVIGFAGAGNMAAAMARGWAGAGGRLQPMLFCDLDRERASALAAEVEGETRASLPALVADSEVVLLAVKPAALDDVAEEMGHAAPALLSVMAATPTQRLAEAFPGIPVLRVMPNQAVEVRRGVLCHPPTVSMPEELETQLLNLLEALGSLFAMPEAEIEAAMAVMSCAPAYVALFAGDLAGAGAERGPGPCAVARARGRDPGGHRRAARPPQRRGDPGRRGVARRDDRGGAERPRGRRLRRRDRRGGRGLAGALPMSFLIAAIGREEIADYVDALFLVYLVLIFIRVLLSWVPRMPYIMWLRAIVRFIEEIDRSRTSTCSGALSRRSAAGWTSARSSRSSCC